MSDKAFCTPAASPSAPDKNGADDHLPETIAVAGAIRLARLHAQGAQIYQCAADANGNLQWVLREPIAALFDEAGNTVGRHYSGPRWELDDGSLLVGKAVAREPAPHAQDIPLVKLEAKAERPTGALASATFIQRIATRGGQPTQPCQRAGDLLSVAYAADYVFLAYP